MRKRDETLPDGEKPKRNQLSGFEYMWQQIKELELVFMKLGEKTRRLRRVKSHL